MFLSRIMEIVSGSKGDLNHIISPILILLGLLDIWRARWMSLVASTSFQNIPAIQTRSFVAFATSADQDVDGDFLYQVQVVFRAALMQADENHLSTAVSMLQCLCLIIPILQKNSRYILFLVGSQLITIQLFGTLRRSHDFTKSITRSGGRTRYVP